MTPSSLDSLTDRSTEVPRAEAWAAGRFLPPPVSPEESLKGIFQTFRFPRDPHPCFIHAFLLIINEQTFFAKQCLNTLGLI